jgi:hypothetical protein
MFYRIIIVPLHCLLQGYQHRVLFQKLFTCETKPQRPGNTATSKFVPWRKSLPVGQDFLIIEALRSLSVRHSTLGRSPLDEWSARPRNFYLTTHNTHNRQTSVTGAGFEPAIPASERPETRALERAAQRNSMDSKNIYLMDSKAKEMIDETGKFYYYCR